MIDTRVKEAKELKTELENLIEDNKNLAQRVMHLESYTDKLTDMLDKVSIHPQKILLFNNVLMFQLGQQNLVL